MKYITWIKKQLKENRILRTAFQAGAASVLTATGQALFIQDVQWGAVASMAALTILNSLLMNLSQLSGNGN